MAEIVFESVLKSLREDQIKVEGEFLHGSNYTFLVKVKPGEGGPFLAVYKPTQGERILWDFPDNTLAHREVAAYLVSQALGWDFIPPTIYRHDGPFGPGSIQLFIDHDPNYHYFNFSGDDFQRLRPVVLFDLLVNNADRKGSHIILGEDGHLWLIDHGLCFNVTEKLRTVLWDFAGEPIPDELRAALKVFRERLDPAHPFYKGLKPHLAPNELDVLARRADRLIKLADFPFPPNDRRAYPFPAL